MNKLTPKQALFVNEYLLDLNATQAAVRAGYRKNAKGIEPTNLTKFDVLKTIVAGMDKAPLEVQELIVEKLREFSNRTVH